MNFCSAGRIVLYCQSPASCTEGMGLEGGLRHHSACVGRKRRHRGGVKRQDESATTRDAILHRCEGRAGLWGRRRGGSEGLSLCPSAHHSAAQSRGCTWVGSSQSSGFPVFGAPGAQCYEVGCPHPRRDVPSAAHSQGLHSPPKAEGSAEGTPDFMPPTVWQWGGATPSLGSAGAAIHPHQNCHLYGRKAKGRASTEQLQEEILYHLQLDASLWGGGDGSQTISAERNRERD